MDVVWAKCVSAVAKHRPIAAANMSVLLYACTLLSTILIIDNQWIPIVAFMAGNWVGTFSTVRWWTR